MPNAGVLVLIGCTTGVLAGMLGAGGGFATVVLLIAAGVGSHFAVGTSLVYTVIIGSWGTAVHLRQGTASPPLALALGIPSAGTALLGAQIAESLSDHTLTLAFGVLTAAVGAAFVARPARKGTAAARSPDTVEVLPISGAQVDVPMATRFAMSGRVLAGALAGGAFIGVMKGLFGVGGGFLLVPFMVLVLGVPEHLAVGSSLFAILLGSISGAVRHATLGNVDTALLPWLVPGGLVGSFVGAKASQRMSPKAIRWMFVALMAASASYLLAKAF